MSDEHEASPRPPGRSGKVTGPRFLLVEDGVRVLPDHGLFQGGRQPRRRNRDSLPN